MAAVGVGEVQRGVLGRHFLFGDATLQAPQAWVLYLALPVGMLLIAGRLALALFLPRTNA